MTQRYTDEDVRKWCVSFWLSIPLPYGVGVDSHVRSLCLDRWWRILSAERLTDEQFIELATLYHSGVCSVDPSFNTLVINALSRYAHQQQTKGGD